MRSSYFLTASLLMVLPISAQAQLNKHDQSIANYGYSVPIIVQDTPALTQPGQTLRDDVDTGNLPTAPVATPTAPAMPTPVTAPGLASEEHMLVPPKPATDLEEDMDKIRPVPKPSPAPVSAPAVNAPQETGVIAPVLPPAMPPAAVLQEQMEKKIVTPTMPPAQDLEDDVDALTEKKTLASDATLAREDVTTPESLEILASKALSKGQQAKNFSLKDPTGKTVNLYEELEKGPVVLIWYRGGWCPYCNLQLKKFQDELGRITNAGAQLIAISPELPDNSMTTAQKNNLSFAVLSDLNNAVAREYGLVYNAPDDLFEKLPNLSLEKHNGTTTREIPLTATYVIKPDGMVAYSLITPDYRVRAEPNDVMVVLGDIAAEESIRQSRIRQALAREAEKVDKKNEVLAVPVPPVLETPADQMEKVAPETHSRIEKLEDKTTIKPAIELKPMVEKLPEGVEPETTLEVRAKEEGLIPETYEDEDENAD